MLRLVFLCVISITELLAENVGCGNLQPGNCCAYGKEYEVGEFVLGFPDNTGSCQRLVCIFGHLIQVERFPCIQGQYPENDKMSMEKVIQRRSILTTIPPTFTTHAFKTTDFTTIPSNICQYNGRWYMPGTLIEKGQSGNWCYSTYCSHDGHLLYGDNFHCMTTIPVFTTVPTTLPTTTTPTPTSTQFFITPMHCFFKDPTTGETVVWRGGTEGKLSDGTACRCEYWGRLSCPENNVGK